MDNTARGMSDTDDVSFPRASADVEGTASENRHTEEIREEIEQTREDMAETIDAIQEKLRPSTIVASATERVKTAATRKVKAIGDAAGDAAYGAMERTREGAGGLMDSIRENPYPAALIGFGLAWWIANASFSRREQQWDYDYGDWRGGNERDISRAYGGSRYRESSRLEDIEDRAKEYVQGAREYVGDTSEALRRTGRRAQTQFQRMLNENPLLVGAGALMLGAAFGLAVPETDRENEWMGDARDSVVDRAQQMAGDAASKVQEAARNVANTAGDVADTVKGKMQDDRRS